MKKILLFALPVIALQFSIFNGHAQNLVPNGDFEIYGIVPCGWTGSPIDFANATSGWTSPTQATPDIFSTLINPSCTNFLPHSTTTNSNGWQVPHSGNIFAGFYTQVGGSPWREYLQVQLTQPMVVGETYRVGMYISLGDNSQFATNNIGVGFSDVVTNSGISAEFGFAPEINFTGVISDTAAWTFLCDTIVATSAWQYIIIGNYFNDAGTSIVNFNPGGFWDRCYYYCDDVEVEQITLAPVALFNAPNHICPGTCTDFSNLSLNGTSFLWTFTGASPSTSTDVNPATICYNTPGNYSVSLIATNPTGSDTLTLNNYITVFPYPAAQGIQQSGDSLIANQGSVNYQWYFNGAIIPGATEYFYIAPQSGDYNVVATDGNGCEVEAVISDVVAGFLQPLSYAEGISVFPNPASESVTIFSASPITAVETYNSFGQKISVISHQNTGYEKQIDLDVNTLPPAVYLLKATCGDKIFYTMFIKH